MLVELRIDVPDNMSAEAVCRLLDDMTKDIGGRGADPESDMPRASDANWESENGDIHYWHPD